MSTRTSRRRRASAPVTPGVTGPVLILCFPLLVLAADTRIVSSVDVPKFTVLALAGAAAASAMLWEVRRARSEPVRVPRLWLVILGVYAAALVMTSLTSTMGFSASLWGAYPRTTGLLYQVAAVLVGLAAAWGLREPVTLHRFAVSVAGTGWALGVYGVGQRFGIDPIDWGNVDFGGSFATLGNSNILSGALAIMLPFSGYVVWRWRGITRALAAAGTAVTLAALVFTRSTQGLVALAGALAVAVVVLVLQRGLHRERPVLVGLVTLLGFVVVMGGAVALQDELGRGLEERVHLYDAAFGMLGDHPLTGVGVGSYGDRFGAFRPVGHVRLVGSDTADQAHSIPIGMLAEGGLLLGLAYLAMVLVTVMFLVRLHRDRTLPPDLLVMLAAAWVAYQIQSLVSIDTPVPSFLHLAIAGAIVGQWHRTTSVVHGIERAGRGTGRQSGFTPVARTGPLLVGALALMVFAVLALNPYRAERSFLQAAKGSQAGDLVAAEAAFRRAQSLRPTASDYYLQHSGVLQQVGQPDVALAVLLRGGEANAGTPELPTTAALLARSMGLTDVASDAFAEAVRRDPWNPLILLEAAETAIMAGDVNLAIGLLERLHVVYPDDEALAARIAELTDP